MLSKDVQEQIVTKTHQAPSNPNISDTWIHEQVPVLADAVQVCKQADLQILTLYSVLPANQALSWSSSWKSCCGERMCSGLLFPS